MAEKLCLQWNDFQDNVNNAFRHMRDSTDFTDVTLACEDGQQIEVHKVILAASSPFFQKVLKKNNHGHPLIYMRGGKTEELKAIVDFLYLGEANVFEDNLESFLSIAEELQLKGLEGTKKQDGSNDAGQQKPRESHEANYNPEVSKTLKTENETSEKPIETENNKLTLPKASVWPEIGLELDETIKAMMETSENMIKVGKQQKRAKICKICGKEGYATDIKRHIEAKHVEGVSLPCNLCDKILRSRNALLCHISRLFANILHSRTRETLRQHKNSYHQ